MDSSGNNSTSPPPRRGGQGRVRWRRFAIAFVPSVVVVAAVLGLTAQGALASSFSISGQQFQVSASTLNGYGFQQFGTLQTTVGKKTVVVAQSEIGTAYLSNLCQSLVTNLGALGTYTLQIRAGNSGTPVSASDLIVDANQLSGSTATFRNINIGVDASTVNDVTGAPVGLPGTFAQEATHVTIQNLNQTAYFTSAGTFTLPGFRLNLLSGNKPCF